MSWPPPDRTGTMGGIGGVGPMRWIPGQYLDMLDTCDHAARMGMIQIRNVPDPLHRELKARAEGALRDHQDLRIERYRHDLFLGRSWALRYDATAYDAVYLALARPWRRRS
jgi:hypothetical protein